ncbi:MAG: bifunctional UDP-N-acetylglucosamine diphosphorylase/glucosamine-1-phosphate N-acetyltransferase GlmU [Pyrinomonadaceae bacterium]
MSNNSETDRGPALDVLILAAGLGTRMRSRRAKVLHMLAGRPLINHVARTAAALEPRKIYVVVGHQADAVRAAVLGELAETKVEFVTQTAQLGTGDAVNAARRSFEGRGDSTLLVLSGDVPMIRAETLSRLVEIHRTHRGHGAACTILTVEFADPTGYGRIVRDVGGQFDRIVEQKDATEAERAIREINAGIYCFETAKLFDALSRVGNQNSQGEYYLTDVPAILAGAGEDVAIYLHNDAREIEGVNNRVQLAELEDVMRRRAVDRLMIDHGVTFIDPASAFVGEGVMVGADTIIYPNVTLEGDTVVGEACVIRSGSRLTNAKVGDRVRVLDNSLIVDSTVGDDCTVGPFAHLRGNAVMQPGAKVGNFVELKKTMLGRGSKANHLTYLGDATIGDETNIGAGTITCNYDGKNKNPTTIGDRVKIGSDTMLVAPVEVGDDAVTAAGSVVIEDVPANSLVAGVPAKVKKRLSEAKAKGDDV